MNLAVAFGAIAVFVELLLVFLPRRTILRKNIDESLYELSPPPREVLNSFGDKLHLLVMTSGASSVLLLILSAL